MVNRYALVLSALLLLAATAPAGAQERTPPQQPAKPNPALLAKMDEVSKWTKQQWYAAKALWVKEKVKWADCQQQAAEKKLSGRKSWPFLYGCMTSNS